MNLNKVILIGRVTKDPELKTTPTGAAVAKFGLATNHTYKDKAGQKKEDVAFHNIILWNKLAEIAGQYIKKGQLLMVEGRIEYRQWEDKEKVKRYATEILGDNIQMGPKSSGTVANVEQEPTGEIIEGDEIDLKDVKF